MLKLRTRPDLELTSWKDDSTSVYFSMLSYDAQAVGVEAARALGVAWQSSGGTE